jgi:hypothetical protein
VTDKGGVQVYPSGHNVGHAFKPCSLYSGEVSVLIGSLFCRGAHLGFLVLVLFYLGPKFVGMDT